MKKLLLVMVVSLMLAGVASANTVWNPANNTPPIVPPATGLWSDTANWANGLPVSAGDGTPGNDHKAVFNVPDAAECIVDYPGATARQLSMGDNNPMTGTFLRVVSGGTLNLVQTGNTWSAVGYSRQSTMTVERGGRVDSGYRLMVGRDGSAATGPSGAYPSYLNINGGTVTTVQNLQIGNNDDNKIDGGGIITVNGGLLDIGGRMQMRNPAVSYVDIGFGKIILNGDRVGEAEGFRDAVPPNLMAFGGVGTLVLSYNSGTNKTTVTATGDPLARIPTYDGISKHDPTLTWINLPSIPSGGPVWVDVRFGTDVTWDPNAGTYVDFPLKASAALNQTSQAVVTSTGGDGEYIWRVDTYRHGNPAHGIYTTGIDPNVNGIPVDTGVAMYFQAYSDFPIASVEFTSPLYVTARNISIPVSATVTDDGVSPITLDWSSRVADPNITFTNVAVGAYDTGAGTWTVTADVSVDYDCGPFNVVLAVDDSSPLDQDDASGALGDHENKQDLCAATRYLNNQRTGVSNPGGDIDNDCDIDLDDAALLAEYWAIDYEIKIPTDFP